MFGDKERVDLILTNPPFGGEEERGILGSFPEEMQTTETALLFLQLIMRKLKRPGKASETGGRAAVVVPNGTLFADGIAARIKEELLKHFNMHTIVRLPEGVFAPYTDIPANLIFFDRSGPTKDIWFYQIPPPDGRKKYTKTKPMEYAEFTDCLAWWNARQENAHAWKVPFADNMTKALAEAQPHWDAVEQAKQESIAVEQSIKGLEKKLSALKKNQKQTQSVGQLEQLEAELRTLKHDARNRRTKQKEEQAKGDAIYWPLFNLDIKNPNSLEALEHREPEELIAEMVEKERRVLGVLEEINKELRATVHD